MPTSGAAAATTKNTMPRTPRRPEASRSSGASPVVPVPVLPGTTVSAMTVAPRAVARRRGRDVEGGVAVEEADRLEHEAGVVHRHDRPVLRPRDVGETERVPDDDVG